MPILAYLIWAMSVANTRDIKTCHFYELQLRNDSVGMPMLCGVTTFFSFQHYPPASWHPSI